MGCGLSTLLGFRSKDPLLDTEPTAVNTTTSPVEVQNLEENTTLTASVPANAMQIIEDTTANEVPVEIATTQPLPVTDTEVEVVPPEVEVVPPEVEVAPPEVEVAPPEVEVAPPEVEVVPLKPSAITKLPQEILHLVLLMAADTAPGRRQLIAVCYQWRKLIVETSWLWTSVRIVISHDPDDQLERILWNLELQIERCGSLPLDVFWGVYINDINLAKLFRTLAQRAPFPRWKSLALSGHDSPAFEPSHLVGMGDFQNLETFQLHGCSQNTLLNVINRTVTSKLTRFENQFMYMPLSQFRAEMFNLLKYTTRFFLPYLDADATFELPPNITDLKVNILPDTPLPHVTRLTTNYNWIRVFKNANLTNLLHLDTWLYQRDDMDQQLTLLSLQTLKVHGPHFNALTLLTAPCLQTLSFECEYRPGFKKEINSMLQTLTNPWYHLSPFDTLELNAPFGLQVIERAMIQSPRISNLTFQLDKSRPVWDTIRALFVPPTDFTLPSVSFSRTYTTTHKSGGMVTNTEVETRTMQRRNRTWRLCPRLRTLRVELKWVRKEGEEAMYVAYMKRILEERVGGSLKSVTFAWDTSTEITIVSE